MFPALNSNLDPLDRTFDPLTKGLVLETDDDLTLVSTDQGLVQATCAASCFIRPQNGDEVLIYKDEGESEAFVLAILRRNKQIDEAEIVLPTRSRLKSEHLTLDTPILDTQASQIDVKTNKINLKGDLISLNFSIFQQVGRIFTSFFRSFLCRSKEAHLEVEETSVINASRIKLTAKDDLIARSSNLDLQAKDSVKIDGRSIRLG
jgi:hypothetical protein